MEYSLGYLEDRIETIKYSLKITTTLGNKIYLTQDLEKATMDMYKAKNKHKII